MAEKVVVIGLPAGWASVAVGDSCVVNPRTFLEPVESHCSVSFIPMAAVEAKTGRIDLSQVRTYGEVSKPESTDGRPWGQPLKQPEGAPLNLG